MQNGRFPTGRRGKYKQRQKKSDTLCPQPGPGVVSRAEGINVSANIVYVMVGELYTGDFGPTVSVSLGEFSAREILGHLPVVLRFQSNYMQVHQNRRRICISRRCASKST